MYIWLNTILQGGVLTPETPPLRTPMQSIMEFKQEAAKKFASYIYFKVLISVL